MSKKIPLFLSFLLIVASIIITFNATYIIITEKHNAKLNSIISEYSFYSDLLDLDNTVRKNFIGEINDSELKSAILKGYINGLGDNYSDYLTKEEYETFQKEQNGDVVGIGVNVIYDNEKIEVISVYPNSSAEEVGIMPGDFIVAVNGLPISEIGYYGAIEKIKGQENTTVSITIRCDNNEKTVNCIRKIILSSTVSSRLYSLDNTIGIIRISEFNSTTPDDFKKAVEDLKNQGCNKYVFDLRNNGGGELNSIVTILDYILPEGPITHISLQNGTVKDYTSDEKHLDAKIAVLVNKRTASAAELFSCAIQDYSKNNQIKATIVGTATYGKGVLQSYYQLKNGDAFKITSGRYDPPYSGNYDGKGVTPDIEIELSDEAKNINFYKLTDETDNQLSEAIKYLIN